MTAENGEKVNPYLGLAWVIVIDGAAAWALGSYLPHAVLALAAMWAAWASAVRPDL